MRLFRSRPEPGRSRVSAYLLVNLATLLWAGNVVLGRALHTQIGPWSLACARGTLAGALFAAVLWQRRGCNPSPSRREWWLLLGMSMSGVVLFQGLLYSGLHHTTAGNAGLINGAGPLLTVFLARLMIADPIRPRQILGAVISLAGVVVIVNPTTAFRGGLEIGLNPGDLLILAAVTLWGVYSVLGRILLAQRDTFWVTGVSTLLAVPLLLGPATVEVLREPPMIDGGLILALLYIGAGPSFVAFLAWNEGIRCLGPGGAMSFYNTLPVFTIGLAWVFLGEAPQVSQWLGGGLVVGGCLLASQRFPRLAETLR